MLKPPLQIRNIVKGFTGNTPLHEELFLHVLGHKEELENQLNNLPEEVAQEIRLQMLEPRATDEELQNIRLHDRALVGSSEGLNLES